MTHSKVAFESMEGRDIGDAEKMYIYQVQVEKIALERLTMKKRGDRDRVAVLEKELRLANDALRSAIKEHLDAGVKQALYYEEHPEELQKLFDVSSTEPSDGQTI